ncbi:hypothetical protein [Paenibacillus sp. FSL H3-0286]|uniref:hypothetical protein n=1 Tax=Paenibacillus sp. FSL H3-0286 TaxID=2921427 RepID=UPI00325300DA
MLNKIKEKLRNKLRHFLRINDLENKLTNFKRTVGSNLIRHDEKIELIHRNVRDNSIKIEALHNTLSNVVSMGSDIAPNNSGNSWAVVCVEGNYNIIKFFDLSQRDGREMLRLLKSFEGGRYVNDTPMGYFPKSEFINWER